MNPLDHASLDASQRLVKAGIVLETDAVWVKRLFHTEYELVSEKTYHRASCKEYYPAPSMVEVWRELPDDPDVMVNLIFQWHRVVYGKNIGKENRNDYYNH